MSLTVEVADREDIALGRRIKEILEEYREEKGEAFSIRAFSQRIGLSRWILTEIVEHGRRTSSAELELIANGFGLPVERIKRVDTQQREEELVKLIRNRMDFQKALQLALYLESVAIGCSEKCDSLNNLGIIYYFMGHFQDAERVWMETLSVAKKVEQVGGGNEPLYKVLSNLLLVYKKQKNIRTLLRLVEEVEPSLDDMPAEHAGKISFVLAEIAGDMGNSVEYRKRMYDSLHYFRQTGDRRAIGRAEHCVADTEYELGNYLVAKQFFEAALESLSAFADVKYITVKDYVKTLLKLGEGERAIHKIEKTLEELHILKPPVLYAKFLLLHSVATDRPQSAEKILQLNEAGETLQRGTCQYLMGYYGRHGDAEGMMKYFKLAGTSNQDTFWEGI